MSENTKIARNIGQGARFLLDAAVISILGIYATLFILEVAKLLSA